MNKEKEARLNQILKEKRMSKGLDNDGNLAYGLYDLIKKYVREDFRIVEIGSYEGASTELFRIHCQWMASVDPYHRSECFGQEFQEDLKRAEEVFNERMKNYEITKIKEKSKFAVDQFDHSSLDLVYIDGDHREPSVCLDILLWYPKVKIGGYIAGHDWGDEGVQRAVKRMLGEPDETFSDSSWIFKKIQGYLGKN